jgi:uncharacterized protein (DUF1800 family)
LQNNDEHAAIALNRFGLGARPGDLELLVRHADAARDWLLAQAEQGPGLPADLRALPATPSIAAELRSLRIADRARKKAASPSAADIKQYGKTVRKHYLEQSQARYRAAATTDRPFAERLVHFWANHFAVSVDKQPLPALAGAYEIEAIRPHTNGNFADLLLAAVAHPAMLMYLDNARSIGPTSPLGQRASRRGSKRSVGLNENLAREILELHTLGVDGGYDQDDVAGLARIITGWSIGGAGERGRFAEGEPGRFEFRENIHEPGAKTVLGRRYADDGYEQGVAVLKDLAVHPSTASHIAEKLARHFVGDQPPPRLIERLATAWRENDAELAPVYRTLVESPEAWTPGPQKYKSPHDFVVSSLRALEHAPDDARSIVGALDLMGQPAWRPGSPAGWPDTADEWGGADALYKRIEWSGTVASVVGDRVDPVALADAVLGASLATSTRNWIGRAESREQGLALLLASPDFQRR